jgi:ribosome modulation factor
MPENKAFQEGYEAYWGGVDPDDNPYASGTADRLSWDEGWSQAQLEDDAVEG